MKKIIMAFGTRPEAIKMGALYHQLKATQQFDITLYVTAQHRDMLDQVLNIFDLKPDVDLDLMQQNQSLAELTAKIISQSKDVFEKARPDLVLVHGDTATSLGVAMAAFFMKIPIAHVEAGLRTGNLQNPFPEELNRRVIALATKFHFAPTIKAKNNLLSEGVEESSVLVTGNTVIDSMNWVVEKIYNDEYLHNKLKSELKDCLEFDIATQTFVLITVHRRENFGANLEIVCSAIAQLALNYPNVAFVIPVHPNPSIKEAVYEKLSGFGNIKLLPPMGYQHFIILLKNCHFIVTDSGGIQEEAPTFRKPILILREATERPEIIDAGLAKLVGVDVDNIVASVKSLLEDKKAYNSMSHGQNPFGDGTASKKIINFLHGCF